MSRIATGLLIVAAVLAFNAGMLRDVLAEDQSVRVKLETSVKPDNCAAGPRGTRIMALLLCLEALRPAGLSAGPKV
ncbi:MAG TPA: hypothetical protein VG757_07695 [Devosia sp.]|nr:hypothetical protein [Devosia sp.]